ncbi:MAG: microcin C transport system substrate-binding protein [Candidatus Pseudothioglobus sp.]|jgi:microcin C transport system substrate-binding protein
MHLTSYKHLLAILLLGGLLSGCGNSETESKEAVAQAPDNTQEVKDYYAANPDFFTFKTLADLPAGLIWEDGMEQPEIGSDNAVKGGTEYSRLGDFPRTLRHAGPDSNGSFRPWLLDNTAMLLAHRHPDTFEFYPGLASSWAVDTETKTVYVKLNPDARWSDGEAVTVEDFLFMFFMYQSDYTIAPWYKETFTNQFTNITRFDNLTFSITVPEAKPDLASRVLELNPKPRHFFRELGDDYVERYQWKFEPTTGAYIIKDKDIKKGTSITLTRLKDWWAKDNRFWKNRFNIDRVQLTVMRDSAKVFEAFKKGDIDQFGLNLAEYWYDKLPNTDTDVANGYIQKTVFYNQRPRPTYGLWMNTSQPLLDNRDIRVGINYATNWQLVIDKFFRGDYQRMQTSSDGYGEFSHPTLTAREYDIDKALEAFEKAGFTQRNADGILINNQGQKLAFTLSTGYESMKDVITILKEEALKAGLELRIEVLDGTAGWKKVQEKQHDIHFSAFGVSLEMYPRYWEIYHSDNAYDKAFLEDGSINPARKLKTQTNNLEALASYELDQLIDRYRASDDKQEMIALSHTMTEMLRENASFVPGFFQPFYRLGHWRWMRYPENFNHKHSSGPTEYHVHWIDAEMRRETQAAQEAGTGFGPAIRVFDQFK